MTLRAHIWPLLIGIAIVAGINTFEHRFMPVVKDFVVQEIQQNDTTIVLSGWMRKDRNCKFAGIVAEGIDANGNATDLDLSFRDNRKDNATRPIGTQSWGPWTIEFPLHPNVKKVTLTSVHHCHPAWATTTKLVDIQVQPVEVSELSF